jgi:membrane-anchored protein YejM (alkaline phosphatase superfamily)
MKEILSNRLGRISFKVLKWGVVFFVISAGGTGLLMSIMRISDKIIGPALFGFLYGIFYLLGFISFYLLAISMIVLLGMTIVYYSKRYF